MGVFRLDLFEYTGIVIISIEDEVFGDKEEVVFGKEGGGVA
jgi:hypothetical protein